MQSDNDFDDDMLYLRLLGTAVEYKAKAVVRDGGTLPASLGQQVYDEVVASSKEPDSHGYSLLTEPPH